MALTVKPILPRFGAEVSGVDLTRPIDIATQREIVETMDRWGVCVYRNTGLDDAGHVAFSRIFGHLEKAPSGPARKSRFEFAELFDASNLSADGSINLEENAVRRRAGDRLWHTDSSFMPLRTSYSLLLAHEVPKEAGETWFADARSAYDDLPQSTKDRIDGLELEHSYWYSRMLAGFPVTEEEVDAQPKSRHPLVMPQASTGRKSLYVASHATGVVGMSKADGRALIRELIDWVTQPQYVFSVQYAVGDMVIWDNLTTMHRGGEFDYVNERRDMRRTTVREGTPPLFEDPYDQFADYFSATQGDTAKVPLIAR